MEQEALYFGENGIVKNTFYKNKNLVNINEVDIKRIALSYKKSCGYKDTFKHFFGYRHKVNAFPALLCKKLPQMNGYSKYFNKNNNT